MEIDIKRNNIIDYLKAFAIILVVLGHSISFVTKKLGYISPEMNVINSLIYSVHVPLFFLISGFLCHKQNLKKFYKKKIVRILIPFIFFSLLKILYSNCISSDFAHGSNILIQLFDAFVIGELYWFSYSILSMFMIVPLLWEKEEKKIPIKIFIVDIIVIIIDIVLMFIDISKIPNYFQILKTLNYLPYFFSGILLCFYKDKIKKIYDNNKYRIIILATIIAIISSVFYYNRINNIFIIKLICSHALMILLYLVAKNIKRTNKLLLIIGKYSYQLMLLDSFYKVIIYTLILKFIKINMILIVPVTIIDIILGIITCIIAEKNTISRFLFGLNYKNK